jgi:FlaA1/EpsC-like NDP-sugar epimerase
VLILGAGKTAQVIVENLKAHPELGLKIVGCLADDHLEYKECGGVPVLGPLSFASHIAQSTRVRMRSWRCPGSKERRSSD